jgi:hypothetical protein
LCFSAAFVPLRAAPPFPTVTPWEHHFQKTRWREYDRYCLSFVELINILTACRLREDLDHGSDDYPIETSFLFSPHVSPPLLKPLWKKADKAALSLRAKELDLLPRIYENCEDIDAGVDRLVRWIKEVVAQYIPLSKPVSFSVSWWSCELTQHVRYARRARQWHTRRLCAEAWRVYLEAHNAKGNFTSHRKTLAVCKLQLPLEIPHISKMQPPLESFGPIAEVSEISSTKFANSDRHWKATCHPTSHQKKVCIYVS